jgi:hypothetical protein
MILSGFFWAITYILIIRQSFQDKTYGMPLVALGLNLSWEFIYTFVTPHWPPYIYTNVIALSLDTIILYQFLRFWKNEFPKLPEVRFYLMFFSTLASCFLVVYFTSSMLNDSIGFHIAFWQNLIMSFLFILMLQSRNNLRGQSIYIATFKMVGTTFASAAFYIYDPVDRGSILMTFTYVATFILDIVYILIVRQKKWTK